VKKEIKRKRVLRGNKMPARKSRFLRIALSGIGDIKYHYHELLKIPEKEFSNHLNQIAKVLSENKNEILLTPSKGVCLEIARKYKQFNGKKVYAVAPLDDKVFGTKHFKENLNINVNGKKLFDETINTDTWYKQHFAFGLFGEVMLMLGASLGTFYEISSAFYVYKIISGNKPDLGVSKKKIHKDIVAGDKFPFTLIIYKPFLKQEFPFEIREYIKKSGGQIFYANDASEIKDILEKLENL
jgi:hypothetical protein